MKKTVSKVSISTMLVSKLMLLCVFGVSHANVVAGTTTAAATGAGTAQGTAQGTDLGGSNEGSNDGSSDQSAGKEDPKAAKNNQADSMKSVSLSKGFTLAPNFKLNAFFLKPSNSKKSTLEATNAGYKQTIESNKNDGFSSVYPVASIAAKLDGEYARGVLTIEARLMKDDAPWSNTKQTGSVLYFDETFVNIGREKGFNVDVGFCDSAAVFAFAGNSKYYKGPDRGVFGAAARYFMWLNEVKNKRLDENTVESENTPTALPNNILFFRDNVAGDVWNYQPRWTMWLPELVAGNHKIEAGVGSTFSTQAQDGIYITAGVYDEYSMGDNKLRVALGGGFSTQTDENLKGRYKRPYGITGGISLHTKPVDVGFKLTWNGDSYVSDYTDDQLTKMKSTGNVSSDNNPLFNIQTLEDGKVTNNAFEYNQSKATAPIIGTMKTRVSLWNNVDLTLGGFYSYRNTGFKKNQDSEIKETCAGVSVGLNGPIPNAPFRYGIEFTYMHTENDAKVAEEAASSVINATNSKHTSSGVKDLFLVSLGVVYSPE